MFRAIGATFCLFLTACMMVGPDYKEPKQSIDKHWQTQHASVKEKTPRDAKWWTVFHDTNLTALIHQGYNNNLSLYSAGVRVLQARAQLAQSVGSLYPQQQTLMGNFNYYQLGGNYLQSVLPQTFDAAMLGFSANWEIDFWGKYRRAIQSNDASFLATYAAYDHVLVTLTADIASSYINIRTDQALIRVTEENIQLQKMSLKIARSRYNAGQISLQDVEQAETELNETQSTLPTLVSQLQIQKDVLAVLLGTTPQQVNAMLHKKHGIPKAVLNVDVGIPKETLARRPDVYQARLEAMAQSAAIGATKANLFPSFSLTGTFAFAANNIMGSSLGDIFQWSNRNVTAGPAVNWPLFNYGQITNQVRAQDASFQQSLLKYMNLVLKAQQEVQDNITRYLEAIKSEQYLKKATQSAMKSTTISLVRYKEGETDYTTVLQVEQQQLRVQTSLVKAQGEVPQALVALYRAMGGGWEIRKCNDIVPTQIKKDMAARTNWGVLLKQQNHVPPETDWNRFKQLYLPSW